MAIRENKNYNNEIFKRLESFKSAVEWSDFIGLLENLDSTIKKYGENYVPHTAFLAKRLNQCLHPLLPTGVHLKAIDSFGCIFKTLSHDEFVKSFHILTLGLFSFAQNCYIIEAPEYINLIEKHVVPLCGNPHIQLNYILMSMYPFIESENLDFYNRAYLIVLNIFNKVDNNVFFDATWRVLSDYPGLRAGVMNFILKNKKFNFLNYKMFVKGACDSLLNKSNQFIIRSILDVTTVDYPLDTGTENAEYYNSQLIRAVLQLLLLKDSTLNKRIYKWLNINNNDLGRIENALRTFIRPVESELLLFFKIVAILGDNENTLETLMERMLMDILISMYLWNIPISSYSTFISMVGVNEMWKIFYRKTKEAIDNDGEYHIDNNNNDVHQIDNNNNDVHQIDNNDNQVDNNNNDDNQIDNDDNQIDNNNNDVHQIDNNQADNNRNRRVSTTKNKTGASAAIKNKEILRYLNFAIRNINFYDSEPYKVHYALLANLIARNKTFFSPEDFYSFMSHFIKSVPRSYKDGKIGHISDKIESSYDKESFDELEEYDLVGCVCLELGNEKIYTGGLNPMYLDCDILRLENGILVGTFDGYEEEEEKQFSTQEMCLIQEIVAVHGYEIFPETFQKKVAEFITQHYKYKQLVELAESKHGNKKDNEGLIDKKGLHENIWEDFLKTKNTAYLMHYDLTDYVIERIPKTEKTTILEFLKTVVNQGKYYEILFMCINIVDRKDSAYIKYVYSIRNTLPILQFLLDKFHSSDVIAVNRVYVGYPMFHVLKSILFLLGDLLNNPETIELLRNNKVVQVERYGQIGIKEALLKMCIHLIINRMEKNDRKKLSKSLSKASISGSHAARGDSPAKPERAVRTRRKEKRRKDTDENNEPSEANSDDLGAHDAREDAEQLKTECMNVQKRAFRILNKIHENDIPFELESLRSVKEVIQEFKNDYYVVKNSLFLVLDDTDFILENLLSFKAFIFVEMNKTEHKDMFFGALISGGTEIDLPTALQIYPYTRGLESLNKKLYYEKMLFLSCTVEDHLDIDMEDENNGSKSSAEEEAARNPAISALHRDTFTLVEELWEGDNEMFLRVCIGNPAFAIVFRSCTFKAAFFSFTITHSKKSESLIFLRTLTPTLSRAEKRQVLAQNVEFFKSMISTSNVNFQASMLALDLLDEEFVEPYHKTVSNILIALCSRIVSGIPLNFKFDQDIEILEKLSKFDIQDNQIQFELKNCLFSLLESGKYQEKAFLLIFEIIQGNPGFGVFIEAFIQYFVSEKFFLFSVEHKIALLSIVSDYPQVNVNAIFENLFSGFETSYFMSFQSTNQHKIDSIKHLCALMLANKRGTFDAFGNKLVSTVNMLINTTKNVKKFAYILATTTILKITEEKILHLYPILFEDMISYSIRESNHSYNILKEIIRCIDTSLCLNSKVFDFRLLLLADKVNENSFRTLLLNALEKEYSEKNVQIAEGMKEKMKRTDFNCIGTDGLPGKLSAIGAASSVASSAISQSATALAFKRLEGVENAFDKVDSLLRGAQCMDDLVYYLKEYDNFYKWIETNFVAFNLRGIEEDLVTSLNV